MKKIVFVLLMAVVLGANCQTTIDSIIVVNVGSTKINIPLPNKEFLEVGNIFPDTIKSIVRDSDKLLCFYVESSEYRKYVNNEHDSINRDKYIFIYSPIH